MTPLQQTVTYLLQRDAERVKEDVDSRALWYRMDCKVCRGEGRVDAKYPAGNVILTTRCPRCGGGKND